MFVQFYAAQASFRVTALQVSGLTSPIGIDSEPTFGWQVKSDERDFHQSAYRIVVSDKSGNNIWDSGNVQSARQSFIKYDGPKLSSRMHYDWEVTVFDEHGSLECASSYFETAFLSPDEWTAKWITRNKESQKTCMSDTNIPYYAKSINISKPIASARLYSTALGIYTMKINGEDVTDNRLEPGETQYTKTILYNTYDVTHLLREGRNMMLAQVVGGLFNISYLDGIGCLTQRYSKRTLTNSGPASLKAELYVEYADGTNEVFITDDSWKTAESPSTGGNWWGGEDYNATLEIAGIDNPDFDISQWENVSEVTPTYSGTIDCGSIGVLKSKMNYPLRVVESWKAVSVTPLTILTAHGKLTVTFLSSRNIMKLCVLSSSTTHHARRTIYCRQL